MSVHAFRDDGDLRERLMPWSNGGYPDFSGFDPACHVVRVLMIRHQRKAGYRERRERVQIECSLLI